MTFFALNRLVGCGYNQKNILRRVYRMKDYQRLTQFLVLSVLIALLCFPTFASVGSAVPANEARTSQPPSLGIVQSMDLGGSYQFMRDAISSITNLQNGQVNIKGETIAVQYVDYISVKMYLQKWNGSSWNDVASSATYSDTNEYYIVAGENFSVQSGYYYRTRSHHTVTEGATTETYNSTSPSILIN